MTEWLIKHEVAEPGQGQIGDVATRILTTAHARYDSRRHAAILNCTRDALEYG